MQNYRALNLVLWEKVRSQRKSTKHTPEPATHSRLKTKYTAEAANAHATPCKILQEDNHTTLCNTHKNPLQRATVEAKAI